MFGKLKEKLNGWFSSSKETIEKTEEEVKTEKEIEKAEKIIEKAKKESREDFPVKFDVALKKYFPDLDKVHEEAEAIKKDVEKAKKIEKLKKKVKEDEVELRGLGESEEEIKKEAIRKDSSEDLSSKKNIFSKIKSSFAYKISEDGFNEIFEDLEFLLLENNVALEVVENIRERLSERLVGKEIVKNELESEIRNGLRDILNDILIEPDDFFEVIKGSEKPFVVLFFGINGTGKTTTIAKIAHFLKSKGLKVVLGAGDTFRAASIEQISEHAKNLNVPLVKHDYGSDAAAVGFDAIKYAKSHAIDVVLIDTAGRMHTQDNLIEEIKKIERVNSPDLKIFVAESIAGNDAVEQAKTFNEAIEIDGSILSKADIDEKGGTIISVSYATHKPIFYLGVGQNYEDLEFFDKEKFIERLGF